MNTRRILDLAEELKHFPSVESARGGAESPRLKEGRLVRLYVRVILGLEELERLEGSVVRDLTGLYFASLFRSVFKELWPQVFPKHWHVRAFSINQELQQQSVGRLNHQNPRAVITGINRILSLFNPDIGRVAVHRLLDDGKQLKNLALLEKRTPGSLRQNLSDELFYEAWVRLTNLTEPSAGFLGEGIAYLSENPTRVTRLSEAGLKRFFSSMRGRIEADWFHSCLSRTTQNDYAQIQLVWGGLVAGCGAGLLDRIELDRFEGLFGSLEAYVKSVFLRDLAKWAPQHRHTVNASREFTEVKQSFVLRDFEELFTGKPALHPDAQLHLAFNWSHQVEGLYFGRHGDMGTC